MDEMRRDTDKSILLCFQETSSESDGAAKAGPGRLESGMKGNSASSLLSKPRGIYERLFV
ncbi:hypothetical protein G4228_003748 [Cervus hanglu yarkandensis]|nr:hypothetical protein G4228_003748 [Cervus hanglu yarkandensis]